ncbi:MAG: hypothetical protein HY680_05660 [Chloroflexi bacterium]|nr:hypothetical protein [Chloroflexota bacterium]
MPSAAEPLLIQDFRRFLLALASFTGAMQMQGAAQGWLVYDITGSNLALGVVQSLCGGACVSGHAASHGAGRGSPGRASRIGDFYHCVVASPWSRLPGTQGLAHPRKVCL